MKPIKQQLNKPKDNPISPQLDPNRLIRLKEVLRIVPVSPSTWWNWVATSRAPAPIRFGARVTCWRYADVIAMAGREVQP